MNDYQAIKSPCTPEHLLLPSGNSPCVGICKYNKSNYCVGCKRHSSEITGWINYSTEVRKAIMQDLKDRKIDE
ncbi:hypothetical protein CRYPA_1837 [uncultured Candidatus Thioglobus sp.]|nr:hypothetical protein CRYPA_1837 [uncultured Candidatus Thioglobus sp.]